MALNKRLILADVTKALDHVQDAKGLLYTQPQMSEEDLLNASGLLMKLEQELKEDLGQ